MDLATVLLKRLTTLVLKRPTELVLKEARVKLEGAVDSWQLAAFRLRKLSLLNTLVLEQSIEKQASPV